MSAQYKLYYFNARGRAEPVRFLLSLAKVPFEDVRFEKEEWKQHKDSMPWGTLPVLEVDGIKISQAKAITRYLALKHGLGGETALEQAKADECLEVLGDLRLEPPKWRKETDEVKKAQLRKSIEEEVIPRYFRKFEEIIKKNGNGVLVGKNVTHADIYLVDMVEKFGVDMGADYMAKFPTLLEHTQFVLSQPGIKEWIEKRPQTDF